jgi:hypothetical protein
MLTTCYPGAVTAGDEPVPDSDRLTQIEQRLAAIEDKLYRVEEFHIELRPLVEIAKGWIQNPAMAWRRNRGGRTAARSTSRGNPGG